MRTIDITTSQKVTISYEISSYQERMVAYIIDVLVMVASILIFRILTNLLFNSLSLDYFQYFVILPVIFLYTPVSELIFSGQSIGKKAMGIKIFKIDGSELSITDIAIRWAFRSIDIYLSLGSVATVLISSSQYGQRLGCQLSNTAVVRLKSKLEFSLKDILSIKSSENYQVTYPEVKKLPEQDMVLIKKTIDRYNRHPNKAHTEAIRLLVKKVCALLLISEPEKNKLVFLQTLLKDYVVLTR
ncbi:MAG: hypothetical protein A2W91_05240 [Bacteroidetes bacterium GWF2_38_335]|nr:MAG: hypothetical protein A2W91_05240 [Bacteroidetes bacterium GWF2_38_335]OFY79765.1 MAG: hypothetical protein A2281_10180 [Bacteroidetes bacterium RIFOXYA12_FULL_38_20]HBS88153.1 RDD family protein [Bacteroidales bacterium]